jgi:hypothetical protein
MEMKGRRYCRTARHGRIYALMPGELNHECVSAGARQSGEPSEHGTDWLTAM